MDLNKLHRALDKFRTFGIIQATEQFPLFTEMLRRFGEGYSTPHEIAKEITYLMNDLFQEPPRDARLREEFDELSE
ncbi:MAG: hypothetical protein JWN49_504 [Parcubacteria group bacterium]|nr:hypothetical protein [Parcubacteria group bacterium]